MLKIHFAIGRFPKWKRTDRHFETSVHYLPDDKRERRLHREMENFPRFVDRILRANKFRALNHNPCGSIMYTWETYTRRCLPEKEAATLRKGSNLRGSISDQRRRKNPMTSSGTPSPCMRNHRKNYFILNLEVDCF